MHVHSDPGLVRRLDRFVSFAVALCILIPFMALTGWALHTPVLYSWGTSTAMVPNTAVCFLLAGLSLWMVKPENQPFWSSRKLTANAAAAIFSLLACMSLLDHILRLSLDIDFLMLLRLQPGRTGTGIAIMSPVTAGSFLLLGCALVVIDWRPRTRHWPAQFLCFGAGVMTLFGLFGLLLGTRVSPVGAAPPTVASFLVLNAGLLCSRPNWAIGGILTHRSPGAKWLRRSLPTAFILFGLAGWLLSQPFLIGVRFSWTELALLALLTGCMLLLFVGWVAYMVNRSERDGAAGEQLSAVGPEAEGRLQRWVQMSAAGAVVLMGLLGVLAWHMARQEQRDAAWVAHTHQASAALEITLRHLVDVETGARGYFLTGQAPFLEPYESGRRALVVDLQDLHKLIVDPGQQSRLDELNTRIEAKLDLAGGLVGAMHKSGATPSVAQLAQGKQLMDQVRAIVEEMETAEKQLLVQRSERARATRHLTTTAVGLGAVFGIIFLSIAGITVSREIGLSAKAQVQIKALNTDLEHRVEQRTAELQLEVAARIASEAQLRNQAALLELANDAILVRDLQNRVIFFNHAAQEMYSLSQEQASGRVSHELLQTQFPVPLAAIEAALATTGDWQGELRHRTGQGVEVVVASRWTLQRDEQGAPLAVLEINRDITERKQNEQQLAAQAEALRQSQQALEEKTFMLQSVLDSMIEGLVATDDKGKFILWNPAAEKILGLPASDVPCEQWSTHYGIFMPDKVTPVAPGETCLERALRGEVVNAEVVVRNPALSREVWLEINGSPLRVKDGVLRGGVAAFRDVTQRKSDELEIRKLNEELEARIARRTAQLELANRELEAFSYSVSHDLRSPLRHISGFARILLNDFSATMNPEALIHLRSIEKAVGLMGELIEGLLNMATLGRQPLRLRHTELNPMVEEILSVLRPCCEDRDVEWRIAPLPALECDPVLMRLVFQNLLDNALKYSRGRAKAVIEIGSLTGPPPIIFVRDNGAGFNLKYAEKLFGVFQRFHNKSEFEGTGVGLATVYRILQKHGGTIWAEAEVDKGATFYFATQPVDRTAGLTTKVTMIPGTASTEVATRHSETASQVTG